MSISKSLLVIVQERQFLLKNPRAACRDSLPNPSPVDTQQRRMAAQNSPLTEGTQAGSSSSRSSACPPTELGWAVSVLQSGGSQPSRTCGSLAGPGNTACWVQRPVLARESAFLSSSSGGMPRLLVPGSHFEDASPGARREGTRGTPGRRGAEAGPGASREGSGGGRNRGRRRGDLVRVTRGRRAPWRRRREIPPATQGEAARPPSPATRQLRGAPRGFPGLCAHRPEGRQRHHGGRNWSVPPECPDCLGPCFSNPSSFMAVIGAGLSSLPTAGAGAGERAPHAVATLTTGPAPGATV